MSTPRPRLFAAKLRPPVDPGAMLHRASLPAPADIARARLVLVNGPAGFGKTTALAQMEQALRSLPMATAWLTLDADDNDLAHFTGYLRAVLASVVPGVAKVPHRPAAHADRGAMVGEAFDLIDAVAASDHPFSIFFDDLEKVSDAEVRGVIARLLLTLAPGQRLVFGTRQVPDLGLARLRASGQLLEIGPDQLRFSADETRRFILEARACAMPAEDITLLHERSEGWPVALQLAVLAYSGQPAGGRPLRAFGGTRAEITDYLAAEVLERLPEDMRAFLLATSILETFCAELCDAVMGTGDAGAMIERALRANLFVVTLDAERRWFRYHSLCAEFLRNRLQAGDPSGIAALHRRASQWLADAGRHADALEHARLAGDPELSAAILERCVTGWLHEGQLATVVRWAEALPLDRLAARPTLHFGAALACVVSHRFGAAQRLIDALELSAEASPGPRAREAAMLKFNFAIWSDRLQALRDALNGAVALITPADGFVYPSMLNCIAYLGFLECNAEMARTALAAAKAAPTHGDNEVVRTYSECEAAMMHLVRGELRDARGIAEAELDRLAAGGRQYGTSSAIIALTLADALYERDEIAGARVLLDEHLPIAEDTAIPDLIVSGFLARARIARIEGDARLAAELIGRLQRLGESRGLARLVASALLEKARTALSEGRVDTAAGQIAEAAAAPFWSHPVFRGCFGNDLHDAEIGKARLELFRGGTGAIALLEAQIRVAEGAGRLRRVVKLRGLLAQALWVAGRRQPGIRQLREALALASPEGLVRALADEPWVLPDMLGDGELGSDAAIAGFARRVGGACGPSLASPGPARSTQSAHEGLSVREVEVLGLLARGLSNKEMARELARSEATIATHLRRIYEKLGAHTRTQAIAIARRGGLIP